MGCFFGGSSAGTAIARRRRRGIAVIMAACFCVVLIPILGLAIDGADAYLVREKLSKAVDAASNAGARSLSVGQDVDSQAANAIAIAQSYFNANFPSGIWGSTNCAAGISVGQDTNTKIRWVTVTAGLDMPLYFMRFLNFRTTHISVTAQSTRRDVNVVMVLDHSGSMVMANALPSMETAATAFVNKFASGRDKVGLIVFGGNDWVAYSPSVNFETDQPNVPTLISQIAGGGNTGTAQALWQGYQQLVDVNEPGALNVIVLFTDGNPNGVTADFNPYLSRGSGCTNLTRPKVGYLANVVNTSTWVYYPDGIIDNTATSMSDTAETRVAANSAGCVWSSNPLNVASGITQIPPVDYYGNNTTGYQSVNLSSVTANQIMAASFNAANNAANRIRSDSSLTPVIYVIGLGGTDHIPPDPDFMMRVANDPASTAFNSAQPAGLYVWSPTMSELQSAFLRVASEVLRLAM